MDHKLFKEMLQEVFWIASASVPENSVTSIDWLRLNPEAFPGLWMSILHSENILNSEPLLGE
jgi:nucleolar pre-ribosomal-associated protein 2